MASDGILLLAVVAAVAGIALINYGGRMAHGVWKWRRRRRFWREHPIRPQTSRRSRR